MTRRRFYAPPVAFASDLQSLRLAADESRHLRDVLRLAVADEVYVFNGEGKEFQCTSDEIRRDSVKLEIVKEVEAARAESPLHLTLAVALLKGEKFDLVVQKTTELGVSSIVPVITRLADIRLRDESDASKRVLRWQRIALEAAKQSGRAFVPQISAPKAFGSLVQATEREVGAHAVMFSERDGKLLSEVLSGIGESSTARPSYMVALVGSEGGWTDAALQEARAAGWTILTLGGRILRAETAAIAATVLLQHLFGDLS